MTVYAMNAATLAVSEYTNDANSVAAHESGFYFLAPTGLVELGTKQSEVGLASTIKTGMLSLGVDGKKYVPRVSATLEGDSITKLWVELELDGDTLELGPYELPGRSGPASFVRKWKLSWGLKVDNVAVRLEGSEGAGWKVHGLTVEAELV